MPLYIICILVLALPALAALLSAIWGKSLANSSHWPVLIAVVLGLLASLYTLGAVERVGLYQIALFGTVAPPISFKISLVSSQMLALVFFIGLLVIVFSVSYMAHDKARWRYFSFLALFIFAMVGLILAADLLTLYIFWELVGFCSYLLIGFWYQKLAAIKASKKAFLMNRVGDFAFLIGIILCYKYFGTFSYEALGKASAAAGSTVPLSLIGLLLFAGCMAKSAQFPLHSWLPDAMEGPTPVSALIHAATMVAAGIYMLVMVYPLFTITAKIGISIIGAVTLLMGGYRALGQSDIKKVLAYSTISQLGLMVLAVGIGQPQYAYLHLLFHAFFKAGLFLAAGAIIHSLHEAAHTEEHFDPQNLYTMGGLFQKMPKTIIFMAMCAASMVGLPLFSGFISKDLIAEASFSLSGAWLLAALAIVLSSFVTAAYTLRLFYLLIAGKWRGNESIFHNIHEAPTTMWLCVGILAMFSTFLAKYLVDSPALHFSMAALATLAASALAMLWIYLRRNVLEKKVMADPVDTWYENQIGPASLQIAEKTSWADQNIIDRLTHISTTLTLWSSQLSTWVDTYIVDGSVHLITKLSRLLGRIFQNLQSGYLQWYISAAFFLLLIIFLIV